MNLNGLQSKVLFLYLDEKLPSSRIRLIDLEELIRAQGINCVFKQFPRGFLEKLFFLRELRSYDVVFLQKKLLSTVESFFFFKYAKKTIFDFDDAIYSRDNCRNNYQSARRLRRFRTIVKSADLIVAGNRVLADIARKDNVNVVILPSPVPVKDVDIKSYENGQSTFVIGWVGGKKNLFHFNLIASELKKISEKFDVEVRIISDGVLNIPGVVVKNIPWSVEIQRREIAKFDVGLMPLFDNPWTRGKCGYKAQQYMASAVPAICSDVGGNAEMIEHGISGYKAESAADFYKYIEKMIKNRGSLKVMGNVARKKMLEHCSNEIVAQKIANMIQKI